MTPKMTQKNYEAIKIYNQIKDMFLFLCFLMTAATIGLVSQTFQLSGSWTSFALFWTIASVPYVMLSGSLLFGVAWCFVFLSGLIGDVWEKFFEYLFEHKEGLVWLVLMCGALSYAFEMLYQMIKKRVLLPQYLTRFYSWDDMKLLDKSQIGNNKHIARHIDGIDNLRQSLDFFLSYANIKGAIPLPEYNIQLL